MRRIFIMCVGVCAIGLAPSYGAMVFDNGAPDHVTGYQSDTSTGVNFAENVLLINTAEVRAIRFWGLYATRDEPQSLDILTVRFFDDAPAKPGTLLATRALVDANRTATGFTAGTPSHFTEYKYEASFAPVSLAGGTSCWVSVTNDTAVDIYDSWFWSTSNNFGGTDLGVSVDNGVSWINQSGRELAFQLFDTPVPEPGIAGLIGCSTIMLLRRRRRLTRRVNRPVRLRLADEPGLQPHPESDE